MTPMKPLQVKTQDSPSTDQQVEEFRAAQIRKARESSQRDLQELKARAMSTPQHNSSAVVHLSKEGMAASKQHAKH